MTSDLNASDLILHTNTSNATTAIKDGPIFQVVETELMKVNIWPLMFMFVFAISGFVGNGIVLYVYWLKWKKNNTRIFILCLGFLDFVNCLFNMPVEIAVLWQPISFDFHYLCKISRGCTFVINNTGSLVFVAIAIERYLLVYHPLKYRQLTPRFAKCMCLLAFIIASSVSWPSFVFYGSHHFTIPVADTIYVQGTTCLISDDNAIHTKGLILIFTSVLFALLIFTFIVLTLLYIAIGRKIYIATSPDMYNDNNDTATKLLGRSIFSAITGVTQTPYKTRSARGSSSPLKDQDCLGIELSSLNRDVNDKETLKLTAKKTADKHSRPKNKSGMSRRFSSLKSRPNRKNTVMMRMVTIAFMLSFTPFLIILVIRYTYTDSEYYLTLDRSGKIVYSVFLRSYFINSMVNPFIYGFMNIHFRKKVKDMLKNVFCCPCCTKGAAAV